MEEKKIETLADETLRIWQEQGLSIDEVLRLSEKINRKVKISIYRQRKTTRFQITPDQKTEDLEN